MAITWDTITDQYQIPPNFGAINAWGEDVAASMRAQITAVGVDGDQLYYRTRGDEVLGPLPLPTAPGGSDAGVASYITSSDSATRAALDQRDLSVRQVWVAAYGATGDGSTDDTVAVQAAIDALGTGGGTVHFDGARTYRLTDAIILSSGVTIDGHGAEITKGIDVTDGVVFTNRSAPNARGYGGGGRDITIRNLRTRSEYTGLGQSFYSNCITFHHVSNLLIEGCDFSEGMHNGHYIDLLGCNDVTIRGCAFRGANPREGREYIEAIQIDSSMRLGTSWVDELTSYDGLPTRNVIIDGCRFTGLTKNGVDYPAPPCAVGTHTGALIADEGRIENVIVTGCIWEGRAVGTAAWHGVIRLPGARNVTVANNVFRWQGAALPYAVAIMAGPITRVVPADQVSSTSPTQVTLSTARNAENWTITGNAIYGFEGSSATQAAIEFTGNYSTIVANAVHMAGALGGIRVEPSTGLVIADNMIRGTTTGALITVTGSSWSTIRGNRLVGGRIGISIPNGNSHEIIANFVTDYTETGIIVSHDGGSVHNPSVTSNRCRSAPPAGKTAIEIGEATLNAFFWGNRALEGGAIASNGSGTITSPTNSTS